ncbi:MULTISPECIES: hypothetical protein [Luteimonas]|uniref:hypothetical protein n=1 Tax=Luteimonas TaxID=83614 RepID=UPI0011805B10|nr:MULTISPECIES: hypothetical protein [Luteimonas]
MRLFITGIVIVFSTVNASCASTATAGTDRGQDDLVISLAKLDPNQPLPLVLIENGQIQPRDGCIFVVGSDEDRGVLAVWPSGYELLKEGGKVVGVWDPRREKKLRFGVTSDLNGGGIEGYESAVVRDGCIGERMLVYIP